MIGALRLLCGFVLLSALGLASSHSHHGALANSSHCAVCQVVGLNLDAEGSVPSPPKPTFAFEDWAPYPLTFQVPTPPVSETLPRGPPHLA